MASQVTLVPGQIDELPPLAIMSEENINTAIRIDEQLRENLSQDVIDDYAVLNARRFLRLSLNEALQGEDSLNDMAKEQLYETLIKASVQGAKNGLFNNNSPEVVNILVDVKPTEAEKRLTFVVKTATGVFVLGLTTANPILIGSSSLALAGCGIYSLCDFAVQQIKKLK